MVLDFSMGLFSLPKIHSFIHSIIYVMHVSYFSVVPFILAKPINLQTARGKR